MEVPISMSLVAWLILVLAEDSWLSIAPTSSLRKIKTSFLKFLNNIKNFFTSFFQPIFLLLLP